MTFDDLKSLVGLTFRHPEGAARTLMALNLPLSARWMALLLAVSVSALLAWTSAQMFPLPEGEAGGVLVLTTQPLAMAGIQMAAIVLAAGLMAGVGRMFGGEGRFEDALLLTVWIEVVLLLVQLVQLLLSLILPGLAGLLGILAIAVFLWLTVQFTKALHDFRSGPKVMLGLFATALAVGFVLSFLAAAFGLLPEVPQ
ncbi:YIP1 family protein [Paracoccus stylophorae]|uniref:YIP1 family protein n=1 Tax=Paracoccus stylophorae TaxID=659350 RepID=A0ABY7SXI5_9RHOB|nr:YIP1 family protein [Paracoccus stylophorae]WCR11750.1 YIP1 family protein [Paracoccus stylophorae]